MGRKDHLSPCRLMYFKPETDGFHHTLKISAHVGQLVGKQTPKSALMNSVVARFTL
jgi:hypothetical protein